MILELIFGLITFIIFWFMIFKGILIYQQKKILKNGIKQLADKGEDIFTTGEKVKLLGKLGVKNIEVKKPEVKEEAAQNAPTAAKKKNKAKKFNLKLLLSKFKQKKKVFREIQHPRK